MTFSALWGTLYLQSGNGVFFGPACMPAIDSMDIESSGIDRFGIILGSPRGYTGPVDDACVTKRCSQRNVGFPGPESSGRVISEGFQTENLVSFVSSNTALSLWIEGRPADGHGILIGAGTCQGGAGGDGSVCAVLADCPPRTAACSTTRDLLNAPNSMTLGGSLNSSGGGWAFGPGATEPFLTRGAEDVVRVVGDVMLRQEPDAVTVHPNANITIDLSGAAFAQAFLMPANYKGRFIPPRPFITHPGDCTALTRGVLNQRCESQPDGRVWRCQPDVGGASPHLCDQPADWLPVGQSASVSARSRSSTLSAADARNTLITNEGATGPIALVLPDAQRGMCLKVVLVAPYTIDVRPAERERILRDTNAAGDALRSDTASGSLLELCAVNDTQWAVISKIGAWKDAD